MERRSGVEAAIETSIAGEGYERGLAAEERTGPKENRASLSGVWLAIVAVIAFSTSPVFVLGAAPLSPFEITVGRLGSAAIVVGVLALLTRQPLWTQRADLPRFALFGLITALHFLCYIASLNYTTIARSLAIVYTSPIFVTLFSAWWLKEPIALRKWAGVGVTVAGIAVLVHVIDLQDPGAFARTDRRLLIGDLLALGSAITFGLYSVAGRSQRVRYGLFTYTGTVYGLAALWALPAALLSLTPSGYHWRPLLSLLAAGLVPLGTGHTLYNAALRRTHATVINLIATQEVTGGVLLGALFLNQVPGPNEIVGAAVALAGIALVMI